MLVSLATILARAKRRTQAAPCFGVTSPETVEAVCRAVSRRKGRAVLVIEAPMLGDRMLRALVSFSLHLIHESDGEMALVVRVSPAHREIADAIDANSPSIWVSRHLRLPDPEYAGICRWAADRAYPNGCSVVGEAHNHTLPANPDEIVVEYGVSVLATAIPVMRDGEEVLDRHYLREAAIKARVPLIALYRPMTGREIRLCSQGGVAGIYHAPALLNEPYTAGLYTGLRDRSQSDPAVYARYAREAAAQAALSYL